MFYVLIGSPIYVIFYNRIMHKLITSHELILWLSISVILFLILVFLDRSGKAKFIYTFPIVMFLALTIVRNYCTPLLASALLIVVTLFWPIIPILNCKYKGFYIITTPIIAYSLALALFVALEHDVSDSGAIAISILLRGVLALVVGYETPLSLVNVPLEVHFAYTLSMVLVPLYLATYWCKGVTFEVKLEYLSKLMLYAALFTLLGLTVAYVILPMAQMIILGSLLLVCFLTIFIYRYIVFRSLK